MCPSTRKWAALLILAGWAGSALAQGIPGSGSPGQGGPPGSAPQGQPPPPPSPEASYALAQGGQTDFNFLTAGLGFGAGFLTSVGTTNGVTVADVNPPARAPLILPGLLTAGQAQSARPADQVFFDYNYFNRFRVSGPQGSSPGFNLHQFDVGVELTLLDSRASLYASAPFLLATDNTSGQAIDGLGDINVGLKVALYADRETGNTFTVGFTASAPSGRDAVFPAVLVTNDTTGVTTLTTQTLNPTYLQPWAGGLVVRDRFFVQECLGFIVPTAGEVATFFNNDLGVGYQVFRGECGCLVTSVTPTFNVQALVPLSHRGPAAVPTVVPGQPLPTATSPPGFPDQVFLTGGAQIGLGEGTVLSAGLTVPVTGPRAYSVGVTVGLNYLF